MYDVMQGVKVIEVAEHTFAPSAGVLLADWGANVIKIERTVGGGDPARNLRVLHQPGQKRNGFFEVANRGKRSIALDLTRPEGREQFYKLIETADVFITNLRTDARVKLGIEAADLMKRRPTLIYARATGYGMKGPMASDGGFDYPSSWCRSGSAFVQTPLDGGPPPRQPGSVGDLTGGATLAGAICGALFRRERTGKGAVVDHSLYGVGAYIMTQAMASASLAPEPEPGSGATTPAAPRAENPISRLYKTSDDRWLCLCLLMDKWFPDLARRIGREDMITDPRYATENAKYANSVAMIAELTPIFASKTLAEWSRILAGMEGVWAPLLSPAEVVADEQAIANGIVTKVTDEDGDSYMAACTPGMFDERPIGELRASPAYAQHSDQVMREIGLDDQAIADLRKAGVLL
jgi:crotonobetainyl-CoA:carnitine CoA-transferase CaiB-like acyl-CoA transferase